MQPFSRRSAPGYCPQESLGVFGAPIGRKSGVSHLPSCFLAFAAVLSLSACASGVTPTTNSVPQAGYQAMASQPQSRRPSVVRPHATTSVAYSLSLGGYEASLTLGTYPDNNGKQVPALWITSRQVGYEQIAAFIPSTKQEHIFRFSTGGTNNQYLYGITRLYSNGHIYAMWPTVGIIDIDPTTLDPGGNPTVTFLGCSCSPGTIISENNPSKTMWFEDNSFLCSPQSFVCQSAIHSYNVATQDFVTYVNGPACGWSMTYESVGPSVLCPTNQNALLAYATTNGGIWRLDPSTNAPVNELYPTQQNNTVAVQVTSQTSPDNVWATDLDTSGSSKMTLYQLNASSGAVIGSFPNLPGYPSSGALTSRNGIYAVGRDITYVAYCPSAGGIPASYSPITISYPDNPNVSAGGITTTNDGNAWMLDATRDAIVNITKPEFFCPQSTGSNTVIANRIVTVRPSVTSALLVHPRLVQHRTLVIGVPIVHPDWTRHFFVAPRRAHTMAERP